MTDMPLPVPRATVTQDDVRAVLKGMDPGHYTTRDIYPRYSSWARQEGKEAVTPLVFGMALWRIAQRAGVVHGNVALWNITAEMTR